MARTVFFAGHAAAALLCLAAAFGERAASDMWWSCSFFLGAVYFTLAGLFGRHD